MSSGKQQTHRREIAIVLPTRQTQGNGFALLGLLAWLGFLIIVLVATVSLADWLRQTGREKISRQGMQALANALSVYAQDQGAFPPAATGAELTSYLHKVDQAKEAMENTGDYVFRQTSKGREILDGWSRPIRYVLPPDAAKAPVLISEGPDANDPADDIYMEDWKVRVEIAPPGRSAL